MKARTSFYYKLSNKERADLKAYVRQLVRETYKQDSEGLYRRFVKLTAVTLHNDFGFGRKRIDKLFYSISKISQIEKQKELWKQIDKIVGDQLKLYFSNENYNNFEEW